MIVKRTLTAIPVTLLCDGAENEADKTKFYLKVLSARAVAELQDMIVDNRKPATFMYEVVKATLSNWENFEVGYNKENMDSNLDLLPTNVIMELAENAMKINFPDYEDLAKN